jgi:hypothetical protein
VQVALATASPSHASSTLAIIFGPGRALTSLVLLLDPTTAHHHKQLNVFVFPPLAMTPCEVHCPQVAGNYLVHSPLTPEPCNLSTIPHAVHLDIHTTPNSHRRLSSLLWPVPATVLAPCLPTPACRARSPPCPMLAAFPIRKSAILHGRPRDFGCKGTFLMRFQALWSRAAGVGSCGGVMLQTFGMGSMSGG